MQENVFMRCLHFIHSFKSHSCNPRKKSSHVFLWKSRPRWRVPLTVRLALGFFLAALLAAIATWLIGAQHEAMLRKQSNFYQALLQTHTTLTSESELLKSINSQSTKVLWKAATGHSGKTTLALDEQSLRTLMARYDTTLLTYTSHDLLSQHPDESILLDDNYSQIYIEQQRTYAAGALHTWQVYYTIQNTILQKIEAGDSAQAQNIARLQGEPTYADALSALHSLIQCNEQLSLWVNENANNEARQQLFYMLPESLFAFLGVLLMGILITHPLVRRLKQLHQVTQAVKRGQTDARVSVTGSDEITDASNSVNTMLDGLVGAIQQTTAAKQELDHAYQQQRQLNQMKDQFILHVSHELRTPLTEIYGFLQLLYEHNGQLDTSTQTYFVEQAIHGCEDLLSLFTTILDASRLGNTALSIHLEKLYIHPVIQNIIEQCDPHEIEDHPIDLEVPESLTVCADPQYLHQILRNLLSNAFKYTPPTTSIFIRAEASQEPSRVCISVKDTGPGIPLEEQAILFQQFVRLTRDLSGTIRGTGLGLYLCRQFVEAMNGQIWVESSGIAGEGSSFCFTLPAT
jgi:signal transduction histidine kinase